MKEPDDSKLFTPRREGRKQDKRSSVRGLGVFAREEEILKNSSRFRFNGSGLNHRTERGGKRIERAGTADATLETLQGERNFSAAWRLYANDFFTAAISGRRLLGDFQCPGRKAQ